MSLTEERLLEAGCWSFMEGALETFSLSGDVCLPRCPPCRGLAFFENCLPLRYLPW